MGYTVRAARVGGKGRARPTQSFTLGGRIEIVTVRYNGRDLPQTMRRSCLDIAFFMRVDYGDVVGARTLRARSMAEGGADAEPDDADGK